MRNSKYSVTYKVLIGYLLLVAFGVATVLFIYNKIVAFKPDRSDSGKGKITMVSEVATRLYTMEGISRDIIQNNDRKGLAKFYAGIDTVSTILDSLRTLYTDTTTQKELNSIRGLLTKKAQNIKELLVFRARYGNTDYYDRVMERLDSADYFSGNTDFSNMVSGLAPYQQKELIKYMKNAEKFKTDQAASHTIDSLVKTIKNVLLSLELKEHKYQQSMARKENELLANDLKISEQLRVLRSKIEQEEIQKSLERVQSSRKALNETAVILVIFGVACVITILIFVVLIVRDTNRSRRYRLALEEAKSYAERLLHSKEQIMNTVTHDLRSPLNSILGYSGLMRKTELTPKQEDYLRRLTASSDYTIRLVNDLLDFSRLEAGKILIEMLPFVPKRLIKECMQSSIPSVDPKKIEIELSLPDELNQSLLSDPFRIRQILSNLIGNAYKFTEEGTIKISGEIVRETENLFLKTTVQDSGIGISKAQQKVIFNEFSQAKTSTQREYGGSGLGLAISMRLATLLGGTLEVSSQLHKGSCFTLTVPVELAAESSLKKEKKTIKIKKVAGQRILLVDDDDTQLSLTGEILREQGFKIDTASDGKMALAKIDLENYAVVLTDIQMPQLDGFDLIKRLRTDKPTRNLPVIAISGDTSKAKYVYLESGFTEYLIKPYDANELLTIIANVLHLKVDEVTTNRAVKNTNLHRELYDLTDLLAFTEGDNDSLQVILQSLIESLKDNIEKIEKAKQVEDWQKVGFVAHKMLPMLRQIKAVGIIELLEKLEHQQVEGFSVKQAKTGVTKAVEAAKKILKSLEREIK